MTRVLFVCLGNICRSPTAEIVARTELTRAGLEVRVASAGTAGYHVGEGADPRSIACAMRNGYDLSGHRARRFTIDDFRTFDLVLAMDRDNLRDLQALHPGIGSPPALFLGDAEVPDPYQGGEEDFQRVIDLSRAGVARLMERLRGS